MSYANLLALVSGKKHVWLYRIQRGTDVAYLTTWKGGRTTAPNFFDHEPFDFFAAADFFTQAWVHTPGIKHSRIKQTQRIKAATVTLTLPSDHAFAQKFLDPLGILETRVQILHGFDNDPDGEFVTRFRGRVVGVKPGRTEIALECENNFTAFRRNGLSAVMQRPCRHALYFDGCGLDVADFEVASTATALSGSVVTVTEAGLQANGWYSGGLIAFNGTSQMITKHVGTSLTLQAPVSGLASEISTNGSASVQIAPGCDLTRQTCHDKFDNILNNGAFHAMGDTPFDGRSIV